MYLRAALTMSLRNGTSEDVPSLGMDDPFEFRKDGRVLARLSGASKLGQFTAYEQMEVTADGRRRGYFSLRNGEFVHTPQSKLLKKDRVQLPLRVGLLCRILVGETPTGKTKKSEMQKNVVCLSFVEKKSRYKSNVTDPLGLYPDRAYGSSQVHWAVDGWPWQGRSHAWDPADFCFVITSPRCTSPYNWIWDLRDQIGDSLDDDSMEYYPDNHRFYSFYHDSKLSFPLLHLDEYVEPGDCAFGLMDSAFAKYSCPSPSTAVGQAKRAMTAEKHAPATAPRCARRHPTRTATPCVLSIHRRSHTPAPDAKITLSLLLHSCAVLCWQ